MNKEIPAIKEAIEELEMKVRKEKEAQRTRRLQMLVLLKSGPAKSRPAVAQHLAVHRHTVGRWLGLDEAGGLAAVVAIKTRGMKRGQRAGRPLRVFVQDESRFGLLRGRSLEPV